MITKFKIFEGINLNYSRKNLTKLPELPDNLQELFCDGNKLTSLPKLPNNLEILWCDHNQLTSLPKLPNNLEILWCEHNQLTSLPKLPDNLKELHCQTNQLTSLPKLPDNLKYLYCNHNRFTEPLKGVDRFDIDNIYTYEQIELFQSYEFQKEYIEKDISNYFNLNHIGIHADIKKEYSDIDSIDDLGIL